MSSFHFLFKIDDGEYICCKNLYLGRFLPTTMPFILESVITPSELYQALCSIPDVLNDEQKEHYKKIVDYFFKWSKYERLMYLHEDIVYDFKCGDSIFGDIDMNLFNPKCEKNKIKEVISTYVI